MHEHLEDDYLRVGQVKIGQVPQGMKYLIQKNKTQMEGVFGGTRHMCIEIIHTETGYLQSSFATKHSLVSLSGA